jgi:hypothetical protein
VERRLVAIRTQPAVALNLLIKSVLGPPHEFDRGCGDDCYRRSAAIHWHQGEGPLATLKRPCRRDRGTAQEGRTRLLVAVVSNGRGVVQRRQRIQFPLLPPGAPVNKARNSHRNSGIAP